MLRRSWIVAYLSAQAGLIVLWWLVVMGVPSSRPLFWPEATPKFVIAAFIVPDVLVLAVASGVAAVLVSRRHRWASPALWITVGAVAYATCYCMASMLVTGEAALGTLLMLVAFTCTALLAATYRG